MDLVSVDLETFRIGPGAVMPKPVCATFARAGAPPWLVANGDGEAWVRALRDVVEGAADGAHEVVGANICGFDWPVLHAHFPEMRPALWRALERGSVRDVQVRQKLLNLATVGEVDHYYTPDGKQRDISYSLAALVALYLGKDRSKEKGEDGAEDVWRLNFDSLDGVPSSRYPPEASAYALHDAVDALDVFHAQESRAADLRARGARFPDGSPYDPFSTEWLHVAAKAALAQMTVHGFAVDPAEVARLREIVERELAPDRVSLLVQSGILTPPEPARPYKNGARNADGTPKMTAPEPAHVKKKILQERIIEVVERVNRQAEGREDRVRLVYTEPTEMFPEGQVSTAGEVIADLAPFDPVLGEYDHYTSLGKLVSNEIPRLEDAVAQGCVMHPNFDEMKKTSRTSSRRSRFYASTNIQQIGRGFDVEQPCPHLNGDVADCKACKGTGKRKVKIEPRHAYVARPGWLLVSTDYSNLEMCTAAQKAFNVTGASVMRDLIGKGYDLHAWFAGQLSYAFEPDFNECARTVLGPKAGDEDELYRLMKSLDKGSPEEKKYYKKWRQLAKSPNLGLPGGMGARTLVSYAKKNYGVIIESVEKAKEIKDLWMSRFPEYPEYFRWVKRTCKDDVHSTDDEEKYAYWTPLGMYRAKCYFCEAANGAALQASAAEGGKIALVEITRACWDPTMNSPLYGCRSLGWIHDESLIEVPDDQWTSERAWEISRIQVAAMKRICPDVVIKAEPALMRKWSKGAEAVFDKNRRLTVWEQHEYVGNSETCERCSLPRTGELHS